MRYQNDITLPDEMGLFLSFMYMMENFITYQTSKAICCRVCDRCIIVVHRDIRVCTRFGVVYTI